MTAASLRFGAQGLGALGFGAQGFGAQGIPRRHAVAVGPKAFLALTIAATVVVGVAAGTSPRAGAGLTAALAAGLVVLRRPVVGGIVLAGVVPAVSGLRRGLPVPGLRLSEALIAGIAVILLATVARRQRAPWCAFDWAALGYVAVAALIGTYDLLRRGQAFDSTSIGTLAGPLEFFLLYRGAVVSLQTERSRRAALRTVLFMSVPVSALGLLQRSGLLGVPGILRTLTGVDLSTDYSYAQLHRATGPVSHWQMLGAYLLVVILIAVALLLDRNQAVLRRRWLIGVLIIDAAALLETVSMSPLIAAIVGSIALSTWYGRGRQVLVWLAVAAGVGAVAFGWLLSARYDLSTPRAPGQTTNAIVPNTLAYRYEVWTKQDVPRTLRPMGYRLGSVLQHADRPSSGACLGLHRIGVPHAAAARGRHPARGLRPLDVGIRRARAPRLTCGRGPPGRPGGRARPVRPRARAHPAAVRRALFRRLRSASAPLGDGGPPGGGPSRTLARQPLAREWVRCGWVVHRWVVRRGERLMGQQRVGVWPPDAFTARRRLFAALARAYDVSFDSADPTDSEFDGLLLLPSRVDGSRAGSAARPSLTMLEGEECGQRGSAGTWQLSTEAGGLGPLAGRSLADSGAGRAAGLAVSRDRGRARVARAERRVGPRVATPVSRGALPRRAGAGRALAQPLLCWPVCSAAARRPLPARAHRRDLPSASGDVRGRRPEPASSYVRLPRLRGGRRGCRQVRLPPCGCHGAARRGPRSSQGCLGVP